MSRELVKDRVIKYLIEDLFVPQDMIDTDVNLSEFEDGAEGILDIVVNVKDENDFFVPVMIVKCVDEDIELEGDVLEKEIEFLEEVDNVTMSGRLVLTNGDAMMYADWRGEEYDTEASLPSYEVMVEEFVEMEKMADSLEENHDCDCEDEGCGCKDGNCGCGDDSCGCGHNHE